MRGTRLISLASLAVLACTDGSSPLLPGSGTDAGPIPDAGALDASETADSGPAPQACPAGRSDVTVELVDRFYAHAGVTEGPRAGDVAVAAVFEDEAGWEESAGVPTAPGSFTVPCVPEGEYWLVERGGYQDRYRRRSARSVREVDPWLGRAGAVPAGAGTALAYALDGLSPVEDGDMFELWTPHDGLPLFQGEPGAVRTARQIDLHTVGAPLRRHLDATLGDQLRAVQRRTFVSPQWTVARVVRASELVPASTREGEVSSVQASLRELEVRNVAIDVQLADFLTSVGGPEGGFRFFVEVHALPGTATQVPRDELRRVLVTVVPDDELERLVMDLEVPVLEPMGRAVLTVSVLLPAGPGGFRHHEVYAAELPEAPPGPLVVRPSLGPPALLYVDDRRAGPNTEGLGPTPKLTWAVTPVPGTKHILTLREGGTPRSFVYELDAAEVVLPPSWPSPSAVHVDTVRAAPGLGLERAADYLGRIAR